MNKNIEILSKSDFNRFKKITSSFLLFSSEQSLYETYKDFKKLVEYAEWSINTRN